MDQGLIPHSKPHYNISIYEATKESIVSIDICLESTQNHPVRYGVVEALRVHSSAGAALRLSSDPFRYLASKILGELFSRLWTALDSQISDFPTY
jgi:hypothetical protein